MSENKDILLTVIVNETLIEMRRRNVQRNIHNIRSTASFINMQVYQFEKNCVTFELISPSTLVKNKNEQGVEKK